MSLTTLSLSLFLSPETFFRSQIVFFNIDQKRKSVRVRLMFVVVQLTRLNRRSTQLVNRDKRNLNKLIRLKVISSETKSRTNKQKKISTMMMMRVDRFVEPCQFESRLVARTKLICIFIKEDFQLNSFSDQSVNDW